MKYFKIVVSFLFFSLLLGFVLATGFLVVNGGQSTELFSSKHTSHRVASTYLEELLSPQDNESWLQGDLSSTASLTEAEVVFIAFWSRSDAGSFLIADRLNQMNYRLKERIFGLFVELPVGVEGSSKDNSLLQNSQQSSNTIFPVFLDTQLRVWKAFGSQAWPLVIAFDQRNNSILRSWSAAAFLSEDIDSLAQTFQSLKPKLRDGPAGATPLVDEALGTVDLGSTLFAKKSEISAAVSTRVGYFIADSAANKVLWIDNNGKLKLEIGTGDPGFKDGQASTAQLRYPGRLAYSERERVLYFVDLGNAAIRMFDLKSGEISTVPLNAPTYSSKKFIPGDITLMKDRLFVTSVFTDEIFYSDRNSPRPRFRVLSLPESQIVPMAIAKSREFDVLYIVDQLTRDLLVYDLGNEELRKISSFKNFGFHSFQTLAVFQGEILAYLSNERGQEMLNLYNVKSDTFGQALFDGVQTDSIGLVNSYKTVTTWNGADGKICSDRSFDALRISANFEMNPEAKGQQGAAFTRNALNGLSVFPSGAPHLSQSGTGETSAFGKVVLNDCFSVPVALNHDEASKTYEQEGLVPIKAGIKARFQILLQPLEGYVFSDKEIHTVKTPDGKLSVWNPFRKGLLRVDTPIEPSIGEIQLDTVMCKKADKLDCIRKKFLWNLDAKLTFPSSEFALRSRSDL